MNIYSLILNKLKYLYKNRSIIIYGYFFMYGVFSIVMIIGIWWEIIGNINDMSHLLSKYHYLLFGPAFYMTSKSIDNALKFSQENPNFKFLIISLYKKSLISKIYILITLFGFFWFLHKNIEEYLSEKRVVGEAFIVDSKKTCDWHLAQLIHKFKKHRFDAGEILEQHGNKFEDIDFHTYQNIRCGGFNDFYYVKYFPFETEYIEDSGPHGSGYKSDNFIIGPQSEPKSRFWKIQDGIFIEGDGRFISKY